jgi:hypothetical protein
MKLGFSSVMVMVLSLLVVGATNLPSSARAEVAEDLSQPLDIDQLRAEFRQDASRPENVVTCETCRVNMILNNPDFINYLKRSIASSSGLSDSTRQDWQAIADEIDRIGKAGTSAEETRKARDLASIADVYIQLKEAGLADDLEITPHSLVEINNQWTHAQKDNLRATLLQVLGSVKQYKHGDNPSLEAAFMAEMKREHRDTQWISCRRA